MRNFSRHVNWHLSLGPSWSHNANSTNQMYAFCGKQQFPFSATRITKCDRIPFSFISECEASTEISDPIAFSSHVWMSCFGWLDRLLLNQCTDENWCHFRCFTENTLDRVDALSGFQWTFQFFNCQWLMIKKHNKFLRTIARSFSMLLSFAFVCFRFSLK